MELDQGQLRVRAQRGAEPAAQAQAVMPWPPLSTDGGEMDGNAGAEACWTPVERASIVAECVDELWRYVARHAADVRVATRALADLTGLSPAALDLLRQLHLVLCDDVQIFVERALPALVAGLRPVAPPRYAPGRGVVRGRIDWGATTAARARQGGGDRALHVAAAAHKHLDTLDRRVLMHTLTGLAQSCAALHAYIGDYGVAGWGANAARVEAAVGAALRDWRIAGISAAPMTSGDLTLCGRSSRAAIRLLAQACTRYRQMVEEPTPAALIEVLQQRVLLPLDDDTLYEVWAVLGASAALAGAGWTLQGAALAGQHAIPFTYRSPDGRATARLRFGHTPEHWRRSSRYRALFAHYNLAGATRRPDVILELQRGRQRRYLLIEVKRTRNPGYIADSVYKVLGYLADFERAFGPQEGVRALLLVWDGVKDGAPGAGPETLLVATHRSYRARLAAIMAGEW